jgi:hypothetical protein
MVQHLSNQLYSSRCSHHMFDAIPLLSDLITGTSLGSRLMDFVNRATRSVDEAYALGADDSGFEVTWPAMYRLENAMYLS